ncbi:Retrovirus-related Pol polyprotein from transposon TNT 1-94 [Trichinella britovi]|uniref:Retrovirus-related Pol polyprotein from transposon TNT 1-94 n=1 Tax=Trichinella britovi TaxID=45882 RepID=A0A0V1C572_TRIBR|nr:Retrovirus-related Pol polyprotein from transposon TNT 1-94 [Trichinella britovi]
MRQNSIGGSKYFVTFIDDHSRWCETYFLKNRNEVVDAFMDFKSHAENQTGNKIKTLRSDNATEYCSEKFQKFLRVNGIRHETSVQYTPQQNGVPERKNRTLLDMARCMLLESKLSLNFWAEAISTACYIRNRCPSRSLNGEIPLTLWNGRKLILNYFRTFGERAYVLGKSPGKGKFSTRSKECIFIGYSTESKAYRLWCPAERKVFKSRDVKFTGKFENDETFHQLTAQNQEWPANDTREKENETLELQLTPNESNETHQSGGTLVQNEAEQVTETRKIKVLPRRPRLVRSGRRGRPKKVYQKEEVQSVPCEDVASIAVMNDPKSVAEALSCHESKEWLEAMKREYEALVKNNTWEIVNRPQRQKVITCQWGFLQRPNIDFHERYAPVARLSSIRTILAISANYGLIAHQLDFVSAYLNGEIEEEIYMEIPEKRDEVLKCSKVKQNLDGKVCRIRKSLYGLKQSGRQWYKKLDEKLSQYGLKTTSGDPCIYFERRGRELAIAAIYVDDVIIASNNTARLNELKKALAKSFKMNDMGPIHYCLGIEIKQSANGDIEMSQQKYIMDILEKFRMMNSKPVETQIDDSNKLSAELFPRTEAEKAEMQNMPYRSLVGSLMYLSVSTRPDIAFAKTASYGLRFQRNSGALVGFSDPDWGGNSDDRRSYTGYVFKFGNAAINWESRKQRTVALSSTEAEYMALSEACKEAMHLKRMIEAITGLCKSVVLQSDNQSELKLAKNPVFHARTKHIDIRYHFIREAAERKDVELRYLPTEQMMADVLTKGLFKPKHEKCISEIGLGNFCGKLRHLKLQAQTILVKNDLWEFVNGTKRRPKIVKDDESSLEAAQKWDISDQKAKADLILPISPLELREIKDCETSNEIWLKLASIYESKDPARKATLLKRLILNKLNDEQKMNDFLREFFNCVDKLKAMDMEIADDLLSILLLYAIPDSYENFRIAIESRDELPKPEVLKIKLLEECKARKNREPKHNDAMFARGKCQLKNNQRAIEKSHRKDNEKLFKYKCHRCGKVGHKAKHCRSNPAR